MALSMKIDFDGQLYDIGELEDTVEEFKGVARMEMLHHEDGAVVIIEADEEEVEVIAGALANIALARTIEVRS